MNITVTARHVDITEAMRDHAQGKADWLAKHFDFLASIRITLNVESKRHLAEIIATSRKGETIVSTATSNDMYASLDQVADKAANQLRKFKERIKSHRQGQPEEGAP